MSKQAILYAVLLALMVILSFFGWQSLRGVLFNSSGGAEIFFAALMFLLLMAVFGVGVLVFGSRQMPMAAGGVILLAYILAFGLHWAYFAVFIAGFGLVGLGITATLKEKSVRIKILPSQIARPAIKSLFTVLAVAVAVVIYFSSPAQGLKIEIKVPRPLFDVIVNGMSDFINGQVQNLIQDPASTLVPGAGQIGGKDIQQAIGTSEFGLDQILKLEDNDSLYRVLNQQINFFTQPYKKYLPYGLTAAVFFSLKTLGFIFVFLAGILTQAIFYLLKSFNVIKIGKEMAERETIEI